MSSPRAHAGADSVEATLLRRSQAILSGGAGDRFHSELSRITGTTGSIALPRIPQVSNHAVFDRECNRPLGTERLRSMVGCSATLGFVYGNAGANWMREALQCCLECHFHHPNRCKYSAGAWHFLKTFKAAAESRSATSASTIVSRWSGSVSRSYKAHGSASSVPCNIRRG